MNIYQKLLAITDELDNVAKGLTVGKGNNSYKGVSEADVLVAVKPVEKKHGIYSYPKDREIVYAETFIGEKAGYKPTDPLKKTYKFMIRIKTTYRFVNVEEPSEFVDQVVFSDGEDPMDKAPGKAMTYGDKYALLKAYKIVTGEDTDNSHSNETTPTNMNYHRTNEPSIEEKKDHSTLGDMEEKAAYAEASRIGLSNLIKSLEKPENSDYKVIIMRHFCNKYKAAKWFDIKFENGLTYKDFEIEVIEKLKIEKELADVGI